MNQHGLIGIDELSNGMDGWMDDTLEYDKREFLTLHLEQPQIGTMFTLRIGQKTNNAFVLQILDTRRNAPDTRYQKKCSRYSIPEEITV